MKKLIPERVSYIKLFLNKYNWEGINYSSKLHDCKRLEINNLTTVLNILYAKVKEILPEYISKHNLKKHVENK